MLSMQSRTYAQDPTSNAKKMHPKVNVGENGPPSNIKYTVTCYYAKRFEALRRVCCPSELDYIRSLSRCKKWKAQGGKSNVFFAKTLDDRFVIKQVTKTELDSFIKFGPGYFKYLSESIGSGSPTCLAKILGIYQIMTKLPKGAGKDSKMDVLVMENLLFRRTVTRLYDLKGSSRSRYNPDPNGRNKVLLDQNLIEAMPTSPIFVGNKAKRLLERAVWNDTGFLASVDVMDYSLLVGVDEEKHELVLGIIDFMRQYTWDKHLETWVKASGILGGPKNASPTIISPKQYKKRFRKAMTTYFLMLPDQWSPPAAVGSSSQSDIGEDYTQGRSSVE
ncbi:1-phosphatidylinositol-3-phosphate 5-kinase fab1b [Stylosanthes scabra]|uniref:1-phosphatidylinositol-3-phosphate 5-kinase fab1b n=1 Tax=Stylosanthes scabra TaxID=79078 RepID=A0ABU6X7G7_9FABA|nr:1-phosphatidylinositol-3-phosphate 5-kinase fab1b [Stylosanthes scabra]